MQFLHCNIYHSLGEYCSFQVSILLSRLKSRNCKLNKFEDDIIQSDIMLNKNVKKIL